MRQPFVGYSGKELFRLLGEAFPLLAPEVHAEITALFKYDLAWVNSRHHWLEAAGIAMTNVLSLRPPGNKLEALCCSKKELPLAYPMPPISHGKYLLSDYLPELARLHSEITLSSPNLIVALGNTACWALLHATNIGSIRGAVAYSHIKRVEGPGPSRNSEAEAYKVLPSYHPAAVLRQWSWRPILAADLMKASRECQFPEIRRPKRRVLINPTIEELEQWTHDTLASNPPILSADCETASGMIRCISFAPTPQESICVPFSHSGSPNGSYWPSSGEELRAWSCVRALLESPSIKLGQNFVYDLQYITPMGIRPQAVTEDTMLLHHAIFSEMQKGLGFLGSIYTDEASWKLMRRAKPDTEKRDE